MYLFIDALDECSQDSIEKLLSLHNQSQNSDLSSNKKIKMFLSGQERPHIFDGLHQLPNLHRLSIALDDVSEDIHVFLSLHLDVIKDQFALETEEALELQYRLAQKADGMFQWASTALNELHNADDCTLESLLGLVKNLPSKLGDLYARSLQRILESLPMTDIGLIRKIVMWLLLASRPLTVSEITLALSIDPNDTVVPPRRRRHLGIGRFISKHLTPFVEIVSRTQN